MVPQIFMAMPLKGFEVKTLLSRGLSNSNVIEQEIVQDVFNLDRQGVLRFKYSCLQ